MLENIDEEVATELSRWLREVMLAALSGDNTGELVKKLGRELDERILAILTPELFKMVKSLQVQTPGNSIQFSLSLHSSNPLLAQPMHSFIVLYPIDLIR